MYIVMYCMPNADKKGKGADDDDEEDELKAARIAKQQQKWGYGS
jgi:hypothetical protein